MRSDLFNGCAGFSHGANFLDSLIAKFTLPVGRPAFSWQMFPSVAIQNLLKCSNRNLKTIGNFFAAHFGFGVKRSDFKNLLIGQFALISRFAMRVSASCTSISHVLFLSATIQMRRIATWRIVAMMKHAHSFWNPSIYKRVSKTVCACLFPKKTTNSISINIDASSPRPASRFAAGFVNFLPKLCFRILGTTHVWKNNNITNFSPI